MKREDFISTIVYILMLAVVVLVGVFVIQPNTAEIVTSLGSNNSIAFILLCLLIGVVLNVILVEIGHIIGAKIGGYGILSTCFLGLSFTRNFENNGKFKLEFRNFDGLTGDTIIYPKKEKLNPYPYIILPLIFILIEFALAYSCFVLITNEDLAFLKYGMTIICTIGGIFVLYNYVPVKLDTTTDGYRWTLFAKKEDLEAYNIMLNIVYKCSKGEEIEDVKVFENPTDFSKEVNYYASFKLIKEQKYDEAISIYDNILNSKIIREYNKTDIKFAKLFVLCLKNDPEGKVLYDSLTEIENKVLKRANTLITARAYYAYLKAFDKVENEMETTKYKFEKTYKKELLGFKEQEKEVFELVIDNQETK